MLSSRLISKLYGYMTEGGRNTGSMVTSRESNLECSPLSLDL